jgi:hypothetical protein
VNRGGIGVVVVGRVDLGPGRDEVIDAVEDSGWQRDVGRAEQVIELPGCPRPDEDGRDGGVARTKPSAR